MTQSKYQNIHQITYNVQNHSFSMYNFISHSYLLPKLIDIDFYILRSNKGKKANEYVFINFSKENSRLYEKKL